MKLTVKRLSSFHRLLSCKIMGNIVTFTIWLQHVLCQRMAKVLAGDEQAQLPARQTSRRTLPCSSHRPAVFVQLAADSSHDNAAASNQAQSGQRYLALRILLLLPVLLGVHEGGAGGVLGAAAGVFPVVPLGQQGCELIILLAWNLRGIFFVYSPILFKTK